MFFRDLRKQISEKTDFDVERIQRAYAMAFQVHEHQTRKSGEPFIIHPVEVAKILFQIGGDENMICVALLHDILEDCPYEEIQLWRDKIFNEFGSDIYFLVESISKDTRIENNDQKQREYCERMEEGLSRDVSIFFLKMADLIHNIDTLEALSFEKREKWIQELKVLYLPMISRNFHKISISHREMYLNLMNRLEEIIEKYETQKEIHG